jgi:hypothetical protein
MREADLRSAARVLSLREVVFLNYLDRELDRAIGERLEAKHQSL